MRKTYIGFFVLMIASSLAPAALADTVLSLNFNSTNIEVPSNGALLNATGELVVDTNQIALTPANTTGNGILSSSSRPAYNILSGDIVFDGITFDLFQNPLTPGEGFRTHLFSSLSDNILFQSGGSDYGIDEYGLAFVAENGGGDILTIFQSEGQEFIEEFSASAGTTGTPIYVASGNLSLTPEPASVFLLGTGMLGLATLAYHRRLRNSLD